jgi:uroporphyrin-III C-methyltransferase
MSKGIVYLVGAGPGNPRLLTLEALKILEKAEVVVYDNLVTSEILKLSPDTAEKIFVGKQSGSHPVPQDDINAILVAKGLQGKKVVRLKGGDPLLFGRGGEEAEALKKHGVKFMIIPGITSALAAPAYAGIPVTHRKYSSSVAIVTGHENPTKVEKKVQWAKLAVAVDTIVVLMGVENLAGIAEELIKGGRDPKTEVAIIESGTTSKQRITKGTLDNIASIAVKNKVNPPAVIVIGDVVGLQNELSWFGGK